MSMLYRIVVLIEYAKKQVLLKFLINAAVHLIYAHSSFVFVRILCVYHEKYIIHEVLPSAFENEHNESSPVHSRDGSWGRQLHSVQFPGGPPNVLGRFFVEVSFCNNCF